MKQPAPRDHIEATADGVAAVTDRGRATTATRTPSPCAVADDGAVVAVVCDGVSTTVEPRRGVARRRVRRRPGRPRRPAATCRRPTPRPSAAVRGGSWRAAAPPASGPPSCTFLAARGRRRRRSSWPPSATAGPSGCPAEGEPQTLTEDDSWAAEKIAAGAMTRGGGLRRPPGPRHHPLAGRGRRPDVGAPPVPLRPPRARAGSSSCSDGLWNYAETAAERGGGRGRRPATSSTSPAGWSTSPTPPAAATTSPWSSSTCPGRPSAADPPKGPAA